jgi:hypothetical protein
MNTLVALNSFGAAGAGGSASATAGAFTNGPAGSTGAGPDLAGDFFSRGFNLIGVSDDSEGFTNGMRADIVGRAIAPINPLIGPLQGNGGPTPTHALLSGSPAVDQGNSFGVSVDQRGRLRPFDYPFIPNPLNGDGSDVGAFEVDTTGY